MGITDKIVEEMVKDFNEVKEKKCILEEDIYYYIDVHLEKIGEEIEAKLKEKGIEIKE